METDELARRASELAARCEDEFLRVANSTEGWEDLGTQEGTRGSQKFTTDGKQIVRGMGIIQASCEEILSVIMDLDKKKQWAPMLKENRTVREFDPNFKIAYELYDLPWPLSNRDFVCFIKAIPRNDGILAVVQDIDAGVPEYDGVVRGSIIIAGYHLKRLDARNTQIVYAACSDPKGSIPAFVVTETNKQLFTAVNKIRDFIKKR